MSENIVEIRIEALKPCPLNVRALLFEKTVKDNPAALKAWNDEIESMAKTMTNYKTIVPLIVRLGKQAMTYEVVSGERRRQAAMIAGLQVLPCIIRTLTDDEAVELIAIEDEHRWEFNFYEKGKLYGWLKDGIDSGIVASDKTRERLSGQHGGFAKIGKMSFKEIGDMLGRTSQYVSNRYYIAKGLPEELAPYCAEKADDKDLDKNRFTISKAYEVAVASDANGSPFPDTLKAELARKSIKEGWARNDIRSSIDKYITAQKEISELKRESAKQSLEDIYLDTKTSAIPLIMEKQTGDGKDPLSEFETDKAMLFQKPTAEHPFDILEKIRKKQEAIILEIQGNNGTVNIIENENKLDADGLTSTWKVNINWSLTLKEPEEIQSLAELPEERFSKFDEADKWADSHGGYALDRTPMQKGDKKVWRLMVKKSTLSDLEKQQLYG